MQVIRGFAVEQGPTNSSPFAGSFLRLSVKSQAARAKPRFGAGVSAELPRLTRSPTPDFRPPPSALRPPPLSSLVRVASPATFSLHPAPMAPNGYLALILHAHLPYVRHPEYDEFLEEDWLYEAITETYLPLLSVLYGLADDGVPFQLTLTLTPPLCHMLRDPLLSSAMSGTSTAPSRSRAGKWSARTATASSHEIARFYLARLTQCHRDCARTLDSAISSPPSARLQERGVLEIITCAATHGFLPLMENFQGSRARADLSSPATITAKLSDAIRAASGCRNAPTPRSLDQVLQEANLRWFILDSHGVMFGSPRPATRSTRRSSRPRAPAAFGRDRESSRQVWSAEEGYPGDPAYRDFYRDIGFDLSREYLRRRPARRRHAQIHRAQISPHHRPHAGQGTLQSRTGRSARRTLTPGISWARGPRRSSICGRT